MWTGLRPDMNRWKKGLNPSLCLSPVLEEKNKTELSKSGTNLRTFKVRADDLWKKVPLPAVHGQFQRCLFVLLRRPRATVWIRLLWDLGFKEYLGAEFTSSVLYEVFVHMKPSTAMQYRPQQPIGLPFWTYATASLSITLGLHVRRGRCHLFALSTQRYRLWFSGGVMWVEVVFCSAVTTWGRIGFSSEKDVGMLLFFFNYVPVVCTLVHVTGQREAHLTPTRVRFHI